MIERSLKQVDLYRVVDDKDQSVYYGCDQEWYSTQWKRMAGCGPTAASNLLLYNMLRGVPCDPLSIQSCRHIMNVVWKYITPGIGGVNTTLKFLGGIRRYITDHGLPYGTRVLDVPKLKQKRPTLDTLITYLDQAMDEDLPIAFLNLHSGDTKHLDDWHWVTIVGIRYEEDRSKLWANMMDAGKLIEIDLGLWLDTTQNKGGFVYLPIITQQD